MKVLVTGAFGFIGQNLCAQLEQRKDVELLRFGKDETSDDLRRMLHEADFVFHLAGVNRPKDENEFITGNTQLTETIVSILEKAGRRCPLLIASSTQAELKNPYGESKKKAEEAVRGYFEHTQSPVYIYQLPNVFGKWCRPNYNSVVATFCHNIATDQPITITDPATKLTLVYIDDVVREFICALDGTSVARDGYSQLPRTYQVTLADLASKLEGFRNIRTSLMLPDFEDSFDRALYATFTTYFDQKDFGYALDMKEDERGWLVEFIKSKHVGQIYASRTNPGFSRGNHWHQSKIEKFLVMEGEAEVKFRSLATGDVFSYPVSGKELRVIDVPAGYAHSITNTGRTDMLLLIWSDETFNPDKPDTYYTDV